MNIRERFEAAEKQERERVANAARYVALRKYLLASGQTFDGKWFNPEGFDEWVDQMRKEQP